MCTCFGHPRRPAADFDLRVSGPVGHPGAPCLALSVARDTWRRCFLFILIMLFNTGTTDRPTHIITITETPSGSHLLYVLGAVGPCSAVFGLRAGGLRRPRWTPDVDLIRELTGQSVSYCKSTTYNQQHRRAAPPKKTPHLKIAEI